MEVKFQTVFILGYMDVKGKFQLYAICAGYVRGANGQRFTARVRKFSKNLGATP